MREGVERRERLQRQYDLRVRMTRQRPAIEQEEEADDDDTSVFTFFKRSSPLTNHVPRKPGKLTLTIPFTTTTSTPPTMAQNKYLTN